MPALAPVPDEQIAQPALAKGLSAVSLKLELAGRLRNVGKLKLWYMAVAEAITNALESVEDSKREGTVEVEIQREDALGLNGNFYLPVHAVLVRDNGVGFNEANFNSFCTPDSLHKLSRGGKGLGRLMCLQAFHQLHVNSVYADGSKQKRRELLLQAESPELSASIESTEGLTAQTEVKLTKLRSDYSTTASVAFETLTSWLAEHFLPALVEKPVWLKSLLLKDGKRQIDLTSTVEGGAVWSEEFKINNYDFRAVCYMIQSESQNDKVRLVAAGRVVNANTRDLEHYLPHLGSVSENKTHVVLVHSPFFDEHVNDARNGVSFNEDGEESLLGITASKFRNTLGSSLKARLEERLNKSVSAFKQRIEDVVTHESPFYRHLLLGYFEGKEFINLSQSARDEEILASLDVYKRREAAHLKRESKRLALSKLKNAEYWEKARKLVEQIDAQKKVALAEYITLRKFVLDQLEETIGLKEDGNAHLEEAIHNIVFPQKIDTESSPGGDHQLWILDERLESHRYLASDKAMDGLNGDRPDLLIALDKVSAFASDPHQRSKGYERIVLVEFKRALKNLATVPTDELPHRQMMRYAKQIVEEKARHLGSGRPIQTAADVRFYLYAVCEISGALLTRLSEDENFTVSPTGDGAYAVMNKGRYYVEYLSFPKLLEDAKARNQAFFRKLGLEA